MFGLFIC